ncbi:MAG: hypothetical protein IJ449_12995 [Clostridia bacterium]|nr:hypothetical protein [Clostridia bacterium]
MTRTMHTRRQFPAILSANTLKWLALVFMTFDHIGAYTNYISILSPISDIFRTIGRIAAPLFLFVVLESARHTQNRRRFLRRLYFANMAIGLLSAVTNPVYLFLFDETCHSGDMMVTFFYTVLGIDILETLLEKAKTGDRRGVLFQVALFFGSIFVPILINECVISRFIGYLRTVTDRNMSVSVLIDGLRCAFLPTAADAEYSYIFVLMGLCIYFAGGTKTAPVRDFTRRKLRQCAVFFAFCVLCYVTAALGIGMFQGLYGFGDQHLMVLALPFMLLYNGERGRDSVLQKRFFYWYYPIHKHAIFLFAH